MSGHFGGWGGGRAGDMATLQTTTQHRQELSQVLSVELIQRKGRKRTCEQKGFSANTEVSLPDAPGLFEQHPLSDSSWDEEQ